MPGGELPEDASKNFERGVTGKVSEMVLSCLLSLTSVGVEGNSRREGNKVWKKERMSQVKET